MRGNRDRNDELSATRALVGLLVEDLVYEIPGKQQHVIRLGFDKRLRRSYRQPLPGIYLPCFGCAIHDEVYEIASRSRSC